MTEHHDPLDGQPTAGDLQQVDHGRPGRRGPSRRQLAVIVALVPLVLIGAFVAGRVLGSDDPSGVRIGDADAATATYDWDYTIDPGTAARIAAGEPVEIVPAELTVHVGDTIRIVNNDDANHIVGVFYVAAHSTVTQQFKSEGELSGSCTVHPSGSFTLRVVQ
jgi:plastocyanin